MIGFAELLILLAILGIIFCPAAVVLIVLVVVVMKRRDG